MRYLNYAFHIFALSCYGYAIYTLSWVLITGIPKSDFTTFGPWFVSIVCLAMLSFAGYALICHIKGMINDYKKRSVKKPVYIKPKPTKKWTPPPLTEADKAVIVKVYDAFIEAGVLRKDEVSYQELEDRIQKEGIAYDVDPGDVVLMLPEVAAKKGIRLFNIVPLYQDVETFQEEIRGMSADILRIMGHDIEAKDVRVSIPRGDEKNCCISFQLGEDKHVVEAKYLAKYPPKNLVTLLEVFAPPGSGKKLYSVFTDMVELVTFIKPETAAKLNRLVYVPEFKDEQYDRNIYFVTD